MAKLYSVGADERITRACAAVAAIAPEDRARFVADAAEDHGVSGRGFQHLWRLEYAAISAGMTPKLAQSVVREGWRRGLKKARKPKQGELL